MAFIVSREATVPTTSGQQTKNTAVQNCLACDITGADFAEDLLVVFATVLVVVLVVLVFTVDFLGVDFLVVPT